MVMESKEILSHVALNRAALYQCYLDILFWLDKSIAVVAQCADFLKLINGQSYETNEIKKQTYIQKNRHIDADTHTDRQTYTLTNTLTNIRTDGKRDSQIYIQTDREADRYIQTDMTDFLKDFNQISTKRTH